MEIKNVDEQDTLMVRTVTPVTGLSKVMGSVYSEIAGFMARKGLEYAGPPYARYYNMDMDALDVEMGFPLTTSSAGEGRISSGRLPAGRVATAVHEGSYEGIGETYEILTAFVKEKGLKTRDWTYEYYLNSPEDTAPKDLKTEVFFPIAD